MIDRALALGEDGDGYTLIDPRIARREPTQYLQRLDDFERGKNLPGGFVPTRTRWLINADGTLLGETRLRDQLNDNLRIEGGNVGYFIHPDHRGQGHGHRILALALQELASLGVSRVLVTCNATNARSRRVIEHNGGQFERYTTSPRTGKQVMTFWIENP